MATCRIEVIETVRKVYEFEVPFELTDDERANIDDVEEYFYDLPDQDEFLGDVQPENWRIERTTIL